MADPIPGEQPPRSVATSAKTATHHIMGLLHPESLEPVEASSWIAALPLLLFKKLGEQLLLLLDRANRMMVRNLEAIKRLRQGPTPGVTVGQAQQVNVANQQVNATAG